MPVNEFWLAHRLAVVCAVCVAAMGQSQQSEVVGTGATEKNLRYLVLNLNELRLWTFTEVCQAARALNRADDAALRCWVHTRWSYCHCSLAQSCLTLCNPMDCNTPGFPIHHHLPEFAQTHVHWVGDAIQPSHPVSLPSTFPSIRHPLVWAQTPTHSSWAHFSPPTSDLSPDLQQDFPSPDSPNVTPLSRGHRNSKAVWSIPPSLPASFLDSEWFSD